MLTGGFCCQEIFAAKGAQLLLPVVIKGKRQPLGAEPTPSRRLSRAHIRVERAVRRLKVFRILQTVGPISFAKKFEDGNMCTTDKTLIVCAASTNMQPALLERFPVTFQVKQR